MQATAPTIYKPIPPSQKGRIRYPQPTKQLSIIQEHIMADIKGSETTPLARAQLTRAWIESERLKREILMKPKPKAVDVTPTVKKPRSVPFTEPAEATTAAAPQSRSPKADREAAKPTPPTTAETPTPPDEPLQID